MSADQLLALLPALQAFLDRFAACFGNAAGRRHVQTICTGLLSDLPRKTVEPIALAAGETVRALQLWLSSSSWKPGDLIDRIQQRFAAIQPGPDAREPVVGIIDETSVVKKGDKTPGVQRQYLGCVGKLENGIVTVHLVAAFGKFKCILDNALFLPECWDADRARCREAGIPDDVGHLPKWRIALVQIGRALRNGVRFDCLTFDEGYGRCRQFLQGLQELGQTYVAEVPKDFRCWPSLPKYNSLQGPFAAKRADDTCRRSKPFTGQAFESVTLSRQTLADATWRVKSHQVHLPGADGTPRNRTHWLIYCVNEASGEVKYFVSNAAPSTDLKWLLKIAFSRWNVEHAFRQAKSEVGFTHYEGRSWDGLHRHLALCSLVLLFLVEQVSASAELFPPTDRGAVGGGAEPPDRRAA